MRRRVGAEREPAHHGQSGIGERPGESLGVGHALRGRVAAADNGERRPRQQLGAAFDVEQRRRVGDLQEPWRVMAVGQGEDAIRRILEPGADSGHRLVGAALPDGGSSGIGHVLRERATARGKHALGITKGGKQLAQRPAAQAGRKA